jgi:SAM-dependent methyltransferase
LVLALDRDPVVLTEMAGLTGVETRCVDLETDDWPVPETGGQYDALIVTHYLFRPHLAALPSVLKPGGLLIYETFAQGHEMLGRPRRPDFLLAPGELLQVFSQTMHVIAYEDGWIESPSSARVQRIAAMLPIQSNPVLDRFSGYFYPIDYTP